MDTHITLMEALYTEAAGRDDVDETNMIFKVRNAQRAVLNYTGKHETSLYGAMPIEEVDDIMIMVTKNGRHDIFA